MTVILVIRLFLTKTQENSNWIYRVFKNMFILIISRENSSCSSYFLLSDRYFLLDYVRENRDVIRIAFNIEWFQTAHPEYWMIGKI